MTNQYFGDVNDYRKYGLLRTLFAGSELRAGVCWMLTPDDTGPDGDKTGYLHDDQRRFWRRFDPDLYDFLQIKVNGHEAEPASRSVSHFDERLLPNAVFWANLLTDNEAERTEYFKQMWERFRQDKIDVIFFDPDNGLANDSKRLKKHKNSSKFLFRDEVRESLRQEMSVLVYQHFSRTKRKPFIQGLADDLMRCAEVDTAFSFVTPHVVFFLLPHSKHRALLSSAAKAVEASEWSSDNSCRTSETTERRQILVQTHGARQDG